MRKRETYVCNNRTIPNQFVIWHRKCTVLDESVAMNEIATSGNMIKKCVYSRYLFRKEKYYGRDIQIIF